MTDNNFNRINPVPTFQSIDGMAPSKGCDNSGRRDSLRKKNKKQKSDEINIDDEVNIGNDDEHFVDYCV